MSPRSASGIGAWNRSHFETQIAEGALGIGRALTETEGGIGESQRRAPGAAKDLPALDPDHLAQALDIGDEVPGRVGLQAGMGRRAPASALVEDEDVVARRIEEPAMKRARAAAGPAMQKDDRLGALRAAALPIDPVTVSHVQHAGLIRFDRRIEKAGIHETKAF